MQLKRQVKNFTSFILILLSDVIQLQWTGSRLFLEIEESRVSFYPPQTTLSANAYKSTPLQNPKSDQSKNCDITTLRARYGMELTITESLIVLFYINHPQHSQTHYHQEYHVGSTHAMQQQCFPVQEYTKGPLDQRAQASSNYPPYSSSRSW